MDLAEPKRDTACFSTRQWFVGDIAFSTEEDANRAIKLAHHYAHEVLRKKGDEIREAIDRLLP